MLNNVILIGRLTRDPELRYTQTGIAIANFTLAVNRPKQKDKDQIADFIDITAWRTQAENCANYIGKGRLVAIEGKIQTSTYTDQEGKNHKRTLVTAESVKFLDKKKTDSGVSEEACLADDIPF